MPMAASSLQGARSSAVEHTLHTGGVTGSIPVAPTMFFKALAAFKNMVPILTPLYPH